ncbi:MAG: ISAzo13 family transposase [Desulfobacteraceae bacterium]|nr:ISAzo13 family transposase [Desulfobacteraceae bacterium]
MGTEISERFNLLKPFLNEKSIRLFGAAEAKVLRHGGIQVVSEQTGLSRTTISKGVQELKNSEKIPVSRIRKKGGGRKTIVEKMPQTESALAKLIEPALRGEPDSPLLWTSKSLRKLSAELKLQGFNVSHNYIGEILKEKGFSLQANRKTDEGKSHPDRNAQFEHIHETIKAYQSEYQPVISVDAKKKELVGNFKNAGKELCRKKEPEKVKVYDFPSDAEGKAIPYGVYDITKNKGWVSIGIDHDTSEFATNTIKTWWTKMGKSYYPNAQKLLITADGGGSNSSRSRLWKKELQKLSNEIGLQLEVCHFPPATSKWNKIEHRLFSYIAQNWRGKPLLSYEIIINLIGSTTTTKGLKVICELNKNKYKTGIKVTDKDMKSINLKRNDFHGEWNYIISPNSTNK